jgi:hypothetical protein
MPCYNTLRGLNLELYGRICTRTIDYLFKCVPRIKHLKLRAETPYCPEVADPIFWELCFSKYLLELKQLSLEIIVFNGNNCSTPVWDFLMDKEERIKQMKESNYWSSHNWEATFDTRVTMPQYHDYLVKFRVV